MGFLDSLTDLATSAINSVNSFEAVKDRAPNQVGVYLMSFKGKIMYVGRGIEDRLGQSTKGLRKRLKEHWRGASTCKPELHKNRHNITVQIRTCKSVEEAKALEASLIRKHDTVANGWNLRNES